MLVEVRINLDRPGAQCLRSLLKMICEQRIEVTVVGADGQQFIEQGVFALSGVDPKKLTDSKLTVEEWDLLRSAARLISQSRIFLATGAN